MIRKYGWHVLIANLPSKSLFHPAEDCPASQNCGIFEKKSNLAPKRLVYFEKTTTKTGDQTYPCPCRRGAKLVPIYLTDAYGCDRCPQMFVLNEEGKLVEQLTAGYPYARAWRWTGEQWKMIYPARPGEYHVMRILAPLLLLIMGWFLFGQWLIAPFSWLYWFVGVLAITFVLPMINAHFGRRRR